MHLNCFECPADFDFGEEPRTGQVRAIMPLQGPVVNAKVGEEAEPDQFNPVSVAWECNVRMHRYAGDVIEELEVLRVRDSFTLRSCRSAQDNRRS